MKILEAEINLREDTRIVENARNALPSDEYGKLAGELSERQAVLSTRVAALNDRIAELPEAMENFGKEMRLLDAVESVMTEAAGILQEPNTAGPAIAAETEAIELLLQSKRINPKGGGGGGSSPGGGGGGTTSDAAIALMGKGTNEKEIREDTRVRQSVGDSGRALPEEFRRGLDEYFNRLNQ